MRSRVLMVILVFLSNGWLYAQQPSRTLTAQDQADIQQLYARYNQGSDFRDAAMWLSAFAPDATFNQGTREIIGQKALTEYRASSFASLPEGTKRRHWNSSLVLTPTADGAKGRAYWIVMDVSGKQPVALSSGYYDDVFVKTKEGWRIKSRTINSDATAPAPLAAR